MQNADSFVRWFRQVAPYVHDFGGRTFVVAFGGEMVAERARFASFIHDLNLLAALEIRLVLVYGARPQIEAELKAKGLKSQLRAGPARHRRAGPDRGQARSAACCAWRSRRCFRKGCRTRRWRARRSAPSRATTSPRGRSACAKASTSSSPARCARWTRRRCPRSSTSPTSCWCRSSATRRPAKSSTSPGRTSPRASPWPCTADKLLMYTDKLPTNRKGEVVSELTADEADGALPQRRATSPRQRCAPSSTWRARWTTAWRAATW